MNDADTYKFMVINILIISFDYTPFISANSFRWTNVAESFARSGHQVFVITGWRPGMEREELVNGVHVYRVGGSFVEKMRASLRNRVATTHDNEKQSASRVTVKRILSDMLKVVHDHTWKKIYWPDYACTWYFPALTMAKSLFTKHSFSHYITASIPFTSHLVGNKLKQLYHNSRWIVDISDPFCFESTNYNNHRLYSRLNISTERSVFNNAQAISILTNVQKDKYAEYFPESSDKMMVNPNILSNDIYDIKPNSGTLFNGSLNTKLVFIGNMAPGIRTPDLLLEIFSYMVSTRNMNTLELHIFGVYDYCKEAFKAYSDLIGKCIYLYGSVPRTTALQAMKDADFLVNIGNCNPYQEPSKVIEYASTGKPIINIMCIKEDSSAALLKDYPAVFNVHLESKDQLPDISTQLAKYLASPPFVDTSALDCWLKPYRIESVVDNYQFMLEGCK